MPFSFSGQGPLIIPHTPYWSSSPTGVNRKTILTSNTYQASDTILGDLIITNGAFYFSQCYRLYCNNLTLDDGHITHNGSNAVGATAGSSINFGSIGGGYPGGNGQPATVSYTPAVVGTGSTAGALGGNGGSGQTGLYHNGAAGGRADWKIFGETERIGSRYQPSVFFSGYAAMTTTVTNPVGILYAVTGGGGGGGGAGLEGIENTYSGGGGGAGGGIVFIQCAGTVRLTRGSTIEAKGGNGGNGSTNSTPETGGGGGGGGGGAIIITCNELIMDSTSSITTVGGAAGATGSGGYVPYAGSDGNVFILTPNGMFHGEGLVSGSSFPLIPKI